MNSINSYDAPSTIGSYAGLAWGCFVGNQIFSRQQNIDNMSYSDWIMLILTPTLFPLCGAFAANHFASAAESFFKMDASRFAVSCIKGTLLTMPLAVIHLMATKSPTQASSAVRSLSAGSFRSSIQN